MDNLRILSFLTICCCAIAAIKIHELVVPEQLEYGKVDEIVLDCKYQLESKDDMNELIIKWYFEDTRLLYQWFPGDKPKTSSVFNGSIDLSYTASDNKYKKYRAMKITNITKNLSGKYTCIVSSLYSEASLSKRMTIYEPPNEFIFTHNENASLFLCSAYGVFPKPVIKVYTSNANLTNLDDYDENEIEVDVDLVEEPYGLYNATSTFLYDPTEITEPTEFVCELTIPNTNFSQVSAITYYPEGEPTTTTTEYDYEYETSTNSLVADNSGFFKSPSIILLSTSILAFLLWYM